ncbi:MAG: porphobilinogen synthase [Marinicaulis sp.]|nr:porphobilinogen synthase [Marinicaulis sp.]NNL89550.1 porphobilinogen synthase [Marinicaulis sp.]
MNNRPSTGFPNIRLRRPRMRDWSRRLYEETQLSVNDLIWAMFIIEGKGVREPIAAMPGVYRLSIDEAAKAAVKARDLSIPAIALFPYTDAGLRDAKGSEAVNPDNLMCRAAHAMKDAAPEVGLMADVALDPYTDHGHDGLMIDGEIVNDATLDVLAEQAVVEARAGFDIVAPSDMMDGRVGVIRKALDVDGLQYTQIMAYAAKYASAFYGPFREAIGSAGALKGDKRTYQMNPANSDEAMREIALDLAEGADCVMIKPGMPYLDIVRRVKEEFNAPVFVYQVSGEYSMIKAAGQNGWIDERRAMMESLIAFKRAGANGVITYFAEDAAKELSK